MIGPVQSTIAASVVAVAGCPLLAQSEHLLLHRTCLLSGVKRTCHFALHLSACDPKRNRHVPPWFGTWLLRLQSLRQNVISDWAAASGVGSARSVVACLLVTRLGLTALKQRKANESKQRRSRLPAKPGAALQRPRSLIGTPGMPWTSHVGGAADLTRPIRAYRTLDMRCAKAPHGLRSHICQMAA